MPTDDYSAAISGGLKLKGISSSSKVSKHKKKKPKPQTDPAATNTSKDEAPLATQEAGAEESPGQHALTKKSEDREDSKESNEDTTTPPRAGKTEAELRHEERRRKRVCLSSFPPPLLSTHAKNALMLYAQLDERLKREGTKTHKERVEELNRYLSNLSEHHDMPRIGPG